MSEIASGIGRELLCWAKQIWYCGKEIIEWQQSLFSGTKGESVKGFVLIWVVLAAFPGISVEVSLKIGTILPLSGAMAPLAAEVQRGMQLGADSFKDSHPDTAANIGLKILDSQGTSAGMAKALQQLADQRTHLYLGSLTRSANKQLLSAMKRLKKPLIFLMRSDLAGEGGASIPTVALSSRGQGALMAKYANKNFPGKQVLAVVDSQDSHWSDYVDGFVAGYAGKINQIPLPGKFDGWWQKQRTDIWLFPGGYSQAAPMINSVAKARPRVRFLGSDLWDSPNLGAALLEPAKVSYTSAFSPLDPAHQGFTQAFSARYQVPPTAGAALGYFAVVRAGNVFLKTNSNRSSVLKRGLQREFFSKNKAVLASVLTWKNQKFQPQSLPKKSQP